MSALAELAGLLRKRLASTGQQELVRAGAETADGKLLTRNFNDDELRRLGDSELIMRRRVLSDLLGPDRRLKSVHETRRTAAAAGADKSIEMRSRYEPQMFGDKGQLYGYLSSNPYGPMEGKIDVLSFGKGSKAEQGLAPESILPQYGQFGVKLRPEAKNAGSFTLGDSLDSSRSLYPSAQGIADQSNPWHRVAMPGSRLHDLARYQLDEIERVKNSPNFNPNVYDQFSEIEKLLRGEGKPATMLELMKKYDLEKGLFADPEDFGQAYRHMPRLIPRQISDPRSVPLSPAEMNQLGSEMNSLETVLSGRAPYNYIEAQMHGPVTPDMVEKVYDFNYEPSAEIERKLKKLGIGYDPIPEKNPYSSVMRHRPETMGEIADLLGPHKFSSHDYYSKKGADLPAIPFRRGFARGGIV